jgi:beta-glucosidase
MRQIAVALAAAALALAPHCIAQSKSVSLPKNEVEDESAGSGSVVGAAAKPLYLDPSAPIADRISDLLGRMTLEEKVNQTLNDYFCGAFGPPLPTDPADQLAIVSEGMRYLFKFCTSDVETCINTINHYQTLARESSRLGIPVSFSVETLHGSIFVPQLPMPVNLGCTWNTSVVEAGFQLTAQGLTMVGGNIGLSPVVNMFPDPRFGRLQEGFSEDPYLSGIMGVAAVRGLQGNQTDPDGYLNDPARVSTVVKHYLAYGLAEQGGLDGGPVRLPCACALCCRCGWVAWCGSIAGRWCVRACI